MAITTLSVTQIRCFCVDTRVYCRLVMSTSPSAPAPDDPQRWAILFTRGRLRKGYSYVTLATRAGLSERVTIHACLTGKCHATTALKLATALDLILALPPLPHILTAREAQHGQR